MIRKKKQKPIKLIQLKQSQIKSIRHKQWLKQGKKCAILNKVINEEDATLDHKHKKKNQKVGYNGRGLCRGVLHKQINSLEGTIVKKYKRYGVHKLMPLPEFLINLAEYLTNPPMPLKYIHPSEKPKSKYLGKREYNKIKKYYFIMFPRRKKGLPKFKKKMKLSKKWIDLLERANANHGWRKK